MTQRELAELMGMHPVTIAQQETGIRRTSTLSASFINHLQQCRREKQRMVAEEAVTKKLRSQGYTVIVNADVDCNLSGAPDLIAIRKGQTRLIALPDTKKKGATVGGIKVEVASIRGDGSVTFK